MNKKTILILVLVLSLAVFVVGYANKSNIDLNQTTSSCNKEENCCVKNEDCKYVWFTGGCNTQEYVSKSLKEAEEQGMHISEAPPRENVTCTCENNKCVTHG